MRRTSMLATLALVVSAVPIGAADTTTAAKYDPRQAFAETDTNHDGAIDHEEFHARIVDIFFEADRDKDGWLDPEELGHLAFPDDFTADDKDRDGRVSMREFMRVRLNDFTAADKNDDGMLSVDEVVAAWEGKKNR